MSREVGTSHRCRACLSTDVHDHAASRRTGTVIRACRRCGLHAMRDRQLPQYFTDKYDTDRADFEEWQLDLRTDVVEGRGVHALARLRSMLGASLDDPSIFDVGAGDAAFLELARDAGFRPFGNELWPGAIERAREVRGIHLEYGDLSQLSDVGEHDAVTMWCVLAHVPDEDVLLGAARRILKPGGILLLQTPRWSAMDVAGMAVHDLTRGRATRITDRRLAEHHMSLHTSESIRALLERHAYEVVSIEERVRYTFTTDYYLATLGITGPWPQRLARPIDALLNRDLFFRNVLDVYARRPEATG